MGPNLISVHYTFPTPQPDWAARSRPGPVLSVCGDLAVEDVETEHVTSVLEPIWTSKPETASRVRGRIEAILDYAKVMSWRDGENPARWRGHLALALPKRSQVRAVAHHAALSWREIGAFMLDLRAVDGVAARALELAILTATRTGEVLGARWVEIDTDEAVWTIPAERMKARKEHRVPLSAAALKLIEQLRPLRDDDHGGFVFPGARRGGPLSNMALLMLLRRMERDDITTHGFRSTFQDWLAEATSFPSDIAEAALAHTLGSKVQAAYQRGDQLAKRRELMDAWATFCNRVKPDAAVRPIRACGGLTDPRPAAPGNDVGPTAVFTHRAGPKSPNMETAHSGRPHQFENTVRRFKPDGGL